MNRVVITGMAGTSPIGDDLETIQTNLRAGKSGTLTMHEWDMYEELNTRLACPASYFEAPKYGRRKTRSMGRVALMAVSATERALENAGLIDNPVLKSGHVGISYGSSTGSPPAIKEFGNMLLNQAVQGINATTYLRMMSHTAAVNIGVFFGVKGRIIPTSTACTSGSQGIGYAYETVKYGKQKIMIAGGAEELCATEAAVFDTLFATSLRNDEPHTSPRPFDTNRDGLVIGEGAATLIVEELEHAKARGANILAEIVGFGTNSDGMHITQPSSETMQIAIELALQDAQLDSDKIDYICAHGTATEQGDIAESQATHNVFPDGNTPISSLKGYMGHTLGACGALEAWVSLAMMDKQWFAPNLNLDEVDSRCAPLDYIRSEGREIDANYVMSNNFAFGGINTSLIFKKFS